MVGGISVSPNRPAITPGTPGAHRLFFDDLAGHKTSWQQLSGSIIP
jgi:hypothetical protein